MSSLPPEQLAQYLAVMGIQRWVRRSLTPTPPPVTESAAKVAPVETTPAPLSAPPTTAANDAPPPWLEQAPAFTETELPAEAFTTTTAPPAWNEPSLAETLAPFTWSELHDYALQCQACPLAQKRQRVLFGAGDVQARWLLVSDMPNADEDVQGHLFPPSPLGQLLDALLYALGLQRQHIFLTTAVKCHPPQGRDPTTAEKHLCSAYLERQIALIQPQLILALGGLASQQLLKLEVPISELRGQVYYYGAQQIPVIPTFHPNYLLHRPIEKRKVWQDLQRALHHQSVSSPALTGDA